jgi:predicted dehydrogenase
VLPPELRPSRAPLEDNAFVLMEYDNGAVGSMWTSAVNSGAMHSQKVRIVGEKASIEWWDEHPNQLSYEVQGEPARILERGMPYLSAAAGGRSHRRRSPGRAV